ncbi:MAG TPA: EthD domain-containing protein [Pseudomonadales bacterium]
MSDELPTPGAGVKTMYLIRRRAGVSREELIAHWFANHMPGVIDVQQQAKAKDRLHAFRYIATLFERAADPAAADHTDAWDGVAQLWWQRPLPRPSSPFGEPPRDSFQERAEPYWPWATAEYVIVDGGERLAVAPLRFGRPFPTTRSGFHKMTCLVAARSGTDFPAFFRHWLTVHADHVRAVLADCSGFRYVISASLEPQLDPYAGMAEIYFEQPDGWSRLQRALQPDGMERWVDPERTRYYASGTEMIGIP